MKTAISLPDQLFVEAEQVAKRLHMSRSKLYATAIAQFLKQHGSREVTARLNEVYAKEKSQLDPVLHALQIQSLPHEDW
jgi:metal-responsive CopG/Arc/MetJ family transcriptional regulator